MEAKKNISAIVRFVTAHPESNVSRRICRETLGEAPAQINTAVIKQLQDRLEIADEFTLEGYHYLIR